MWLNVTGVVAEFVIGALAVCGRLRLVGALLVVCAVLGIVISYSVDAKCGCLGQYLKTSGDNRRAILALGGLVGLYLLRISVDGDLVPHDSGGRDRMPGRGTSS